MQPEVKFSSIIIFQTYDSNLLYETSVYLLYQKTSMYDVSLQNLTRHHPCKLNLVLYIIFHKENKKKGAKFYWIFGGTYGILLL